MEHLAGLHIFASTPGVLLHKQALWCKQQGDGLLHKQTKLFPLVRVGSTLSSQLGCASLCVYERLCCMTLQ